MKERMENSNDIRHKDSICLNQSNIKSRWYDNIKYLLLGMLLGIVFVKAEIVSWFRIQEMFRFQSFHMYGIIGSAVFVGALSILLLKKLNLKTISGEEIIINRKGFSWGNVIGGLLFGIGWAFTGSCPGPLFAWIGLGNVTMIFALLSAIFGTWLYGFLREKLPH
jgi:uncharacterized membrane protein YedE/YeeE